MSNPQTPVFRPVEMYAPAGTTIFIGDGVQVQVRAAYRGRTKLHIYAPEGVDIDRVVNFKPEHLPKAENNDDPSAPTLEPSAKNSVIDQD
ncbi:carbon storage regulator [Xanthomonas arboricola]|uniref:carbon storage regulator n=1 Tax=Xanthomonas arboricola TaxID=56448 RepID=UPI0011AFD80A|nr:carbon storage regulator [Xanthomonas arboricola]